MNVRCELIDYYDREKAYDNPRVIIEDASFDTDMVYITVGDKKVKVSGKELAEAVSRCLRAVWPF